MPILYILTFLLYSPVKCNNKKFPIKRFIVNPVIWSIFLQAFVVSTSHALDPQKTFSQYIHTNWRVEDGLPQNAVQCIIQTRDGFLWFGTQEGLARFDGVQFTVFSRENTHNGIQHNGIRTLLESADGSLWAGTEDGLTRMHDGKFVTYKKEDGLANNIINNLYEDAQNRLWIATEDGGLSIWHDGKFKTFTTEDELAGNHVTSITETKDGTIYIGTTRGLTKYAGGVFTTCMTADGLVNNNVRTLYLDADSSLWVGIYGGLNLFKNGKWTTFKIEGGLVNNRIRSLCRDHNGNLWIGTNGGGLYRKWGNQISSYTAKDGLGDDFVTALCEDSEGNLWVGTLASGLHCFRDGRFTVFGESEGLAQNNSRSIYEARDGSIWVGSDNHGITRFKGGSLTVYFRPQALEYGGRGICEGEDGSLWIGTYGGGLCRLKDGKFTTYTTKDGLAHNRIFCLSMLKNGNLCIGTRGGGLSVFNNNYFITYTTKEGLASDIVRTVLEGSDGSIWIGTNEGLSRLKDDKLTKYTTNEGLSYNLVYCLFEDEDKALWIGTHGGGLNRFKDGRFTVYTTQQGMFDNTVFQILEDEQKYFWLTCNRGVYRVSEKELNDYADGKIQSVHCTVFGTADGLRSAKCNGSSQPAGIRAKDGRLWIPTMKGVAVIDPAKILQSKLPPPVFIEHAMFDRKAVPLDSLVQVGPGEGELEIHYTALSYTVPKLVKFKYILEEFDKDWVDAGTRRVAYYTNIPPGSYTFRVIAANNDGIWNNRGAAMELKLAAYFYQTDWFRGLMLVVLIVGVYGVHEVRVWQFKKREKHLEQRVQERTAQLGAANKELEAFSYSVSHDLRAPLRSIDGFSNVLLEDYAPILDDQGKDYLQRLCAAAKRLEELIDNMLKLSRVTSSELRRTRVDLSAMAQTIANGLRTSYPERVVDFIIEQGLIVQADENLMWIVLDNLLMNAWKFTGKHPTARIELCSIQQSIQKCYYVRDNGSGFDMAYANKLFGAFQRIHTTAEFEGTGVGLATVQRIIHRHGGRIWAEAEVEKGATFYFTIPE